MEKQLETHSYDLYSICIKRWWNRNNVNEEKEDSGLKRHPFSSEDLTS